MTEIRMSLKDAGEHLGIQPNSVRSRFKKGSIRGERDNSGKIWVWLDPSDISSAKASNVGVSNPSIEEPHAKEVSALKDHLLATVEQLSQAQAEIRNLKPQATEAVRLRAEVEGLREQQKRGEAEVARLTASLDRIDMERRQLVEVVINRPSSFFARLFGK